MPVDRYYIEKFLAAWAADIRGRVLEIDNAHYTRKFGGDEVTRSDVLHIAEMRPGVTIVGDLASSRDLPVAAFDCIVLTQTLQLVYDARSAVANLHRMLKPGGVALVTAPGLSRMTADAELGWGHCWGFTTLSLRRMFEEEFPGGEVRVESWGNTLTTMAFLYGLAAEELRPHELEYRDPELEMLVTLRAVKAHDPKNGSPE